jgi:hypothetical protein
MNKKILLLTCLLLAHFNFAALASTKIVVASDRNLDIPPYHWRDNCSGESNGAYHQLAQRLWHDMDMQVQPLQLDISHSQGLQILTALISRGRIDAYMAVPRTFRPDLLRYGQQAFFLSEPPVYIAVSISSPLAKQLDKLDALLAHYHASGLTAQLLESSRQQWLQKSQLDCQQ